MDDTFASTSDKPQRKKSSVEEYKSPKKTKKSKIKETEASDPEAAAQGTLEPEVEPKRKKRQEKDL